MDDNIGSFFDRMQSSQKYDSIKKITSTFDRLAAGYLNEEASGSVLAVGGVWEYFKWGRKIETLTVLDMSEKMLKAYCPQGACGVIGDFYTYEFNEGCFDTIVFPLILHHTAAGSWQMCKNRISEALYKARRWLRHGGRILIVEYCPHPLWQPLQKAFFPFTRFFLGLFKQPPVVMHTSAFYQGLLESIFGACCVRRIAPRDFNYWVMLPVFLSVSWLKVPFVIYPKMHFFSATA